MLSKRLFQDRDGRCPSQQVRTVGSKNGEYLRKTCVERLPAFFYALVELIATRIQMLEAITAQHAELEVIVVIEMYTARHAAKKHMLAVVEVQRNQVQPLLGEGPCCADEKDSHGEIIGGDHADSLAHEFVGQAVRRVGANAPNAVRFLCREEIGLANVVAWIANDVGGNDLYRACGAQVKRPA